MSQYQVSRRDSRAPASSAWSLRPRICLACSTSSYRRLRQASVVSCPQVVTDRTDSHSIPMPCRRPSMPGAYVSSQRKVNPLRTCSVVCHLLPRGRGTPREDPLSPHRCLFLLLDQVFSFPMGGEPHQAPKECQRVIVMVSLDDPRRGLVLVVRTAQAQRRVLILRRIHGGSIYKVQPTRR